MLQEEEPWEPCPPFTKIRPPPKVSRLDVGSTRLMRDCVYPQLPPLSTRGQPESTFDAAEPAGDTIGLGVLEEAAGLVEPTQPGAPFGDLLSDPLSLDVSTQLEGGLQSLEVGAQHQLPSSPSLLSTWTLGTTDRLTSRADRMQLGSSLHVSSQSPLPTSPSTATRQLPQPFDFTGSSLQPNPQAQPSAQVKPDTTSPHSSSTSSISLPRLHGIKVESPGKRPEIISKSEARGITKLANQACKEPLGSLSNSELLASLSTRAAGSGSTEGLAQSVGLALALPTASASGQGILNTKPPAIPNNMLLQDDLMRQMSPLHRATASYMVSKHGERIVVFRRNVLSSSSSVLLQLYNK